MANLDILAVRKSFGDAKVLQGIDLSIKSGEFFTLLGPSGCGKTTLLRIIAGFQNPDGGRVNLDGDRLDGKPAHKRDIGMVFQDYAVFPHLTAADNIAFGLKTRKLPKSEIADRVAEGLRMVRLDGLGRRLPSQLSGGQQQRVGLARAMVIRPKLLLMDEPLSNLDAKLRIELREDIRDIQKRLGITTIYVTHDQEEALAISDRICVMHAGRAEQIGAPYDIYRKPLRRFPASFVGAMNFLALAMENGRRTIAGQPTPFPDAAIELAIRPENVIIGATASADGAIHLPGDVRKVTFLGREAHYTLTTPAGDIVAQVADPTPDLIAVEGRRIDIALPYDKLTLFDTQGDAIAGGAVQ